MCLPNPDKANNTQDMSDNRVMNVSSPECDLGSEKDCSSGSYELEGTRSNINVKNHESQNQSSSRNKSNIKEISTFTNQINDLPVSDEHIKQNLINVYKNETVSGPEVNMRKINSQVVQGKLYNRTLSYHSATKKNSEMTNYNEKNAQSLGTQNSNILPDRRSLICQHVSKFLEKPDELARSSSFTYAKQASKISQTRRSFPLLKGKNSNSDMSNQSPLSKTSSKSKITTAASLDASSQTSQKKGLMNSIVRQLSFRSNKSTKTNKSKPHSELNDLKGEPGVVDYSNLIKLFECPGCMTLMNAPFYQCRKGHIVCEKCKINLKYICPDCRQRITEETNAMMEKVSHLISFPCRFNKFGCTEYHLPNNRQNHEPFCQYRPVHCHFEVQGCQKVLTLMEMKSHVDQCNFKEFAYD